MEYIKLTTHQHFAVIEITREKALNALNIQVIRELSQVLDQIDTCNIGCLIITGAGEKAFAAGADIMEVKGFNKEEAKRFSAYGNEVFLKIEQFPIPTIAMIQGYALGGGMELALSCDIRVCSEKSVFGLPEVGLGIIPGFGGTQRLQRTVGRGMAKELIYTGRRMKAEEALRIGLINHIYTADLREETQKLADLICRNAPLAVRNAKEVINRGAEKCLEKGITLEADLFSTCFDTWDQKERMNSFIEERTRK